MIVHRVRTLMIVFEMTLLFPAAADPLTLFSVGVRNYIIREDSKTVRTGEEKVLMSMVRTRSTPSMSTPRDGRRSDKQSLKRRGRDA